MKTLAFVVCLAALVGSSLVRAEEPTSIVPGLPNASFGRSQFWTDEMIAGPWRIQRNALTNSFRLLDGQAYRRACGSYEECRECLRSLVTR